MEHNISILTDRKSKNAPATASTTAVRATNWKSTIYQKVVSAPLLNENSWKIANISCYDALFLKFWKTRESWDQDGRFEYHKQYELKKVVEKSLKIHFTNGEPPGGILN